MNEFHKWKNTYATLERTRRALGRLQSLTPLGLETMDDDDVRKLDLKYLNMDMQQFGATDSRVIKKKLKDLEVQRGKSVKALELNQDFYPKYENWFKGW